MSMRKHLRDLDVQRNGLHMLSLSARFGARTTVVSNGGVPAVIRALAAHPEDLSSVAMRTFEAIALGEGQAVLDELLNKTPLPPPAHLDDATIAAANDEEDLEAQSQNAAEACIAAMARQPHQLVTQRAGVTILCRLGTGCGAAGLTSVRNADGLEAVAGALNRHANDSDVAAQAAELLFAIASAAEEPGRRRGAADVYLQNGAIDGLLKAMLKHPTHDQLQRCAARTLIAASLISDRARLTVFGKSGARSLIVAAVRRLPDIASDCHLNLIAELIQPQHLSAEERLMRQMEQTRIENKLIERALDTDLDGDGIIGGEEEDLAVYAALKSPRRLTTPRSARRELGGKMVTPRKAGFIPVERESARSAVRSTSRFCMALQSAMSWEDPCRQHARRRVRMRPRILPAPTINGRLARALACSRISIRP